MTLGPVEPGTVRSPRVRVTVNGADLPFVEAAGVNSTNTFDAATWQIDAVLDEAVYTAKWWASQTQVRVKIFAGYEVSGSTPWTRLVTGDADEYDISLDDNTIHLSGRDLTALFIDTKTADTYQNRTSSQVATLIAQKHGLQTQVTPTKTPVGTYYSVDHTRLALGAFHSSTTEWDLLIYLAQQEGFDVFVDDTTLHFQPVQTSSASPYVINWTRDADGMPDSAVIDLKLNHALTLAPGVSVKIVSWHSGLRKRLTATAKATSYDDSGDSGSTQDYVYYVPNLTQATAQTLANQRLDDITRHLRTITFDAPADTVLTPQMVIKLTGTDTAFNGLYYPDEIDATLSFDEGFKMSVTAKNIPPSAQQTVG